MSAASSEAPVAGVVVASAVTFHAVSPSVSPVTLTSSPSVSYPSISSSRIHVSHTASRLGRGLQYRSFIRRIVRFVIDSRSSSSAGQRLARECAEEGDASQEERSSPESALQIRRIAGRMLFYKSWNKQVIL